MKFFSQIFLKDIYYLITNSNFRKFFKFSLFYGDKPRYLKGKIKFSDLEITIIDYRSFIWQFKEIFVDEIYKFNADNESPVIFDCGANIGISCLFFIKLYPKAKIKAFEADPEIAKTLSSNLQKFKNVDIINKAVWIHNNGIEISLEGADSASVYGYKNRVKVNSARLRDFIDNEKKIDMLKIDIEGAEIEIIKDCKENLSKVENIFIEYHSFLNQPQELDTILKILTENKFRYFIKQPVDRNLPFINRTNKNYSEMDLQLNIFAYKLA